MAQKARRTLDDQLKALMARKNAQQTKENNKKQIAVHQAAIAKLRGSPRKKGG